MTPDYLNGMAAGALLTVAAILCAATCYANLAWREVEKALGGL